MRERSRYTVVVLAAVHPSSEAALRLIEQGKLASFSSGWTTDPAGLGPATHYAFSGAFLPGELGRIKGFMAILGLVKGVSWWDDESDEPVKFLEGMGLRGVS